MGDLFVELLPFIKRMGRQFTSEIFGRVPSEDLAQGAALAALDSIQKAGDRDRQTVAAYCMTKAHWSMIDAFRRELVQTDGRLEGDPLDSAWEGRWHDVAPSAETCALRQQLLEKACAAADTLPADQREVIRRLYAEDQNQAEAGAAMGVTQSRVSQIHSKAIRALRTALA
jgi:RNA polymerase sigma factor (sigma-70 family)